MPLTAHSVPAAQSGRLAHLFFLMLAAFCLLPAIEIQAQDQPLRAASSTEWLNRNTLRSAPPVWRGLARSNRQGVPPQDLSRAKTAARQQFAKSFGELQESSHALL